MAGALNLPRVARPQRPGTWQLKLTAGDEEKAFAERKARFSDGLNGLNTLKQEKIREGQVIRQ